MPKAQSLADVLSVFDPRQPLRGQELQDFYVDRPSNPSRRIALHLKQVLGQNRPCKLLFTGHGGSGKSTELNLLATQLKDEFFIVRLDVQQDLSLPDLHYMDILVGLATSLFRRATDEDVLKKAPAQIVAELWEDVAGFVEKTLLGPRVPGARTQGELSARVHLLAVEFGASFRTDASTREEVRKRVEGRLAEVVDKVNFVADQVQAKYQRPVLFFIENIDKADLETARRLFWGYTSSLTAFRPSAIYTFPIGLRYAGEFTQIRECFDQCFVLPNVMVRDKQGNDTKGMDILRQAVERRADLALFEEEALNTLIRASGGLMRALIRMVRVAAEYAITEGEERIADRHARAAVREERGYFVAALAPEDYPVLAARMQDKELSSSEAVQRLLQAQALLEYDAEGPWCDVNPVIEDLVRERVGRG
ncbi:MAG: hypothetical protein ACUVWW_14315 [Anaerolineae bacterium]